MKKTIMLLLMLLVIPFAFAEEVDAETQGQIKVMDTTSGAEMRKVQLEKAIEAQLIVGEEAIAYIESNTNADVEVLVDLHAELEAIQSEVRNIDVDASAEVVAAEFVELKQSARVVTNAFREEVSTMVSSSARANIRANARVQINSDATINALEREVDEARAEFNKERAVLIATRAGLSADAVARIQANSASNARVSLVTELQSASPEVRASARAHVQEAQTRRAVVLSAVESRLEGLEGRIDARIDAISSARVQANIAGIGIGGSSETRSRATIQSTSDSEDTDDNSDATRAEASGSVETSDSSVNVGVRGIVS